MTPRRILIAPNAFKHSLPAMEAAQAIATGFQTSRLPCTCTCFPVGDGGDGTGALIVGHNKGEVVTAEVHDPISRPLQASFGLINEGTTAVIEMASASGLHRLQPQERDPLRATSFGTGELMRAALDRGIRHILLAIGGSATVDGGTGILRALGVRFLDAQDQPLDSPESLLKLARIDRSGLDPRLAGCAITILCDVANPLVGAEGAAAVFGPQKGATPEAVAKLDTLLTRLADVAATGDSLTTLRHGGAAGGVGAGLHALLGAKLVNGIDYFLDVTRFDEALANADLVITGEGSIDEQTLQGKGPFGVAYRAKQKGLPVIGLAGNVPLNPSDTLTRYFDTLLAIGNGPADLPTALHYTRQNLVRTAAQLGNLLAGASGL